MFAAASQLTVIPGIHDMQAYRLVEYCLQVFCMTP
jgi:hypothetical protein